MSEPMTRDEVLAVVKKHAINTIEGATDESIDKATTLADVGANSLDVVEIVSATMRELQVKVPRTELLLLESLDELVDLLHQYVIAKAKASEQKPPAQ
jgi:acyl carrier protein